MGELTTVHMLGYLQEVRWLKHTLTRTPTLTLFTFTRQDLLSHGLAEVRGMLLPMGYLIGHGYANVIGDPNDVETMRNTIYAFFNENASIPDSGTPYYGYSGAVKCLSEGFGDVAFAKDSTIASYCDNENPSDNEAWCLDMDQYVALPEFGKSPSHPVMYNPEIMSESKSNAVRDALIGMADDDAAAAILNGVLNTPGFVSVTTEGPWEAIPHPSKTFLGFQLITMTNTRLTRRFQLQWIK